MKRSFLLLLIPVCVLVSCDEKLESGDKSASLSVVPVDVSLFSGERALEEVRKFISIGPRHSGTEGSENAARYIARRLKEIGVKYYVDEFSEETPGGEVTFRNVVGTIKGTSDKVVVLVSHYDTKSGLSDGFVGANDSGSSTGLLLEMASALSLSGPTGPGTMLAFVDGEECKESYSGNDGLHGSRRLTDAFIKNGRKEFVRAVMVLDMIGDRDLTVTLPLNSTSELKSLVLQSAREQGTRYHFSRYNGMIHDDHVPFLDAGIPAVGIIDFQFGSASGKNNYWHTDEDTIDKLSAKSLEIIGRMVIQVINKLGEP